jgi:hypothetical protein
MVMRLYSFAALVKPDSALAKLTSGLREVDYAGRIMERSFNYGIAARLTEVTAMQHSLINPPWLQPAYGTISMRF